MHSKMIWFTIFIIYPSISTAFYLSSPFVDPFDPDDDCKSLMKTVVILLYVYFYLVTFYASLIAAIFFHDYPNESNINAMYLGCLQLL